MHANIISSLETIKHTGSFQRFVTPVIAGTRLCSNVATRIALILGAGGGGTCFVGVNASPAASEGLPLTSAVGYVNIDAQTYGELVTHEWFANPSGMVNGVTVVETIVFTDEQMAYNFSQTGIIPDNLLRSLNHNSQLINRIAALTKQIGRVPCTKAEQYSARQSVLLPYSYSDQTRDDAR